MSIGWDADAHLILLTALAKAKLILIIVDYFVIIKDKKDKYFKNYILILWLYYSILEVIYTVIYIKSCLFKVKYLQLWK